MSDWHARPDLIELADAINATQQQRANGVEFLTKPYTYHTDLPPCRTCRATPERIRVGDPDDVMSFTTSRIPVTYEPCGHQILIRPDDAVLVLDHGQQKRQAEQATARPQTLVQAALRDVAPEPYRWDGSDPERFGSDDSRESPSEGEPNEALPVVPDPRQPAYDAVYEYIRGLGEYMPPDPVHRNAVIWRAVHAALGATPVGRCVSSHCVEGGHILDLGETP